jgi:hypothetical protein
LGAESSGCVWETSIPRLKLRHTWTTTMSSNDYRDTIQARIQARTSDGVTGVGGRRAHCPISRECGGRQKAIEGIASFLQGADPSRYEKVMAEISRRMLNQFAAKMKEASLAMLGQTSVWGAHVIGMEKGEERSFLCCSYGMLKLRRKLCCGKSRPEN